MGVFEHNNVLHNFNTWDLFSASQNDTRLMFRVRPYYPKLKIIFD